MSRGVAGQNLEQCYIKLLPVDDNMNVVTLGDYVEGGSTVETGQATLYLADACEVAFREIVVDDMSLEAPLLVRVFHSLPQVPHTEYSADQDPDTAYWKIEIRQLSFSIW